MPVADRALVGITDARDTTTDALMVRTLALTGIRWGELAGLRAGSVDCDKRRLSIRDSVSEVGGALVWSDTKNHTPRAVAYPKSIHQPLLDRIAGRPAGALVFPPRSGEPLRNPLLDQTDIQACGGAGATRAADTARPARASPWVPEQTPRTSNAGWGMPPRP